MSKMNKIKNIDLFVGHFIDSNTKDLPNGISFAGNYYQEKVRSILTITHSISIFYGDKNKFYGTDNKADYIILQKKRYFSNILLIIKNIIKSSRKQKDRNKILFYNLNIYTLFYYIYYVHFKKAHVVVLLTDAEFIVEKKFPNQILRKALSYSHGILSLREILELQKFKAKIEIMPGIISNKLDSNETEKNTNTVLLSGSLGITNGLLLALEFFSNQSQLKLIITGVPYLMTNTEFERFLEKYKSKNVSYLGVLDYEEYISILRSCEFNLSLRNPKEIGHQYNFPSKILEYMSYGNIVISSLYYPELADNIYLKTEYSIKGLENCFKKILNSSQHERELLSSNAQFFVKNHFSEEVFKTKIFNLFNS